MPASECASRYRHPDKGERWSSLRGQPCDLGVPELGVALGFAKPNPGLVGRGARLAWHGFADWTQCETSSALPKPLSVPPGYVVLNQLCTGSADMGAPIPVGSERNMF